MRNIKSRSRRRFSRNAIGTRKRERIKGLSKRNNRVSQEELLRMQPDFKGFFGALRCRAEREDTTDFYLDSNHIGGQAVPYEFGFLKTYARFVRSANGDGSVLWHMTGRLHSLADGLASVTSLPNIFIPSEIFQEYRSYQRNLLDSLSSSFSQDDRLTLTSPMVRIRESLREGVRDNYHRDEVAVQRKIFLQLPEKPKNLGNSNALTVADRKLVAIAVANSLLYKRRTVILTWDSGVPAAVQDLYRVLNFGSSWRKYAGNSGGFEISQIYRNGKGFEFSQGRRYVSLIANSSDQ